MLGIGIKVVEDSWLLPKYLLSFTHQLEEVDNSNKNKNVIETEQPNTESESNVSQLVTEVLMMSV